MFVNDHRRNRAWNNGRLASPGIFIVAGLAAALLWAVVFRPVPAVAQSPEAQAFIERVFEKVRRFQADPATVSDIGNLGVLTGLYRVGEDEHAEEIDIIAIQHVKDVVIEQVINTETGRAFTTGVAERVPGGWAGWFNLACRRCCPGVSWWDQGTLAINDRRNVLSFRSNTFKMDPDECKLTETPDVVDFDMKLVNGAAFKEIIPGKLIHIVTAPAIGNNRAPYKAAVRIGWDYTGLPVRSVSLGYRGASGAGYIFQRSAQLRGEYEFLTEKAGNYTFIVTANNAQGQPLHFEIESIHIPAIPGAGGN